MPFTGGLTVSPHHQRPSLRKSLRPSTAPAQDAAPPLLPCLPNGFSDSNTSHGSIGQGCHSDTFASTHIGSLLEESFSDVAASSKSDMTMNDNNNDYQKIPGDVHGSLSSFSNKSGFPIIPSIDEQHAPDSLQGQTRPPPKRSSLQDLKAQTSSDRTILDTPELVLSVPHAQSAFASSTSASASPHPVPTVSAEYDWATFINAYSWGRWDPHRTPNPPRGTALSNLNHANNFAGASFPSTASSIISPPATNAVVTPILEASSSEELSAEKTVAAENTRFTKADRLTLISTPEPVRVESSPIDIVVVEDSTANTSLGASSSATAESLTSPANTAAIDAAVIQMPPKPSLQPSSIPQSPISPLPLDPGVTRQGTTSLQKRFRSMVPGNLGALNITLPSHRMRSSFSTSSAPSPDLTSPAMSGVSSTATPLTPVVPTHSINGPSNVASSAALTLSMPPSQIVAEIGDKQASAATLRWAAARVNIAPLALPSPEHELTDPMRGVMASVPGSHPHEDFPLLDGTITPGIGGRKTRLSGFWEGMTDVDEPGSLPNGAVTPSIDGVVEEMELGEKDTKIVQDKEVAVSQASTELNESAYNSGQRVEADVDGDIGRCLVAKSAPALLPEHVFEDEADEKSFEQQPPHELSESSLQGPPTFELPSMPLPSGSASSSATTPMEVIDYPQTSTGYVTPSDLSALPRRVCLTRQTSSPLPASTPKEAVYSRGPSQSSAGDMATGSGTGAGLAAAVRQGRAAKEEQMFSELGYLAPPNPPEELERRRALYKFNIWNTGPDLNFDRIAHLAKLVFSTKGVFISLIDGNEQWFKSQWGVSASSQARIHSFCAHTILQRGDEPMIILDTHRDWRFVKNPLVQEAPHIRFYAGAPLRTQDGYNIGTLSIIDDSPREEFAPRQRHTLKEFAAIAMREMELWRDKIQLRIRDRIQNSMEQFSRECLEIDTQAPARDPEQQQHPGPLIGTSMDRVYDRAAKLVKRTLDVEGVVVMDVSHCEVLETMGAEGTVSVIMHSGEPGVESKSRSLSTEEYHKLHAFFGKYPEGKISEGIMPICFRPFLPTHVQYALTVPIYNIDKRPFALLVAYNASEQTKRYLEGHELSYLRAIGVIILSAVLKRRMILADKAKSLFISNISHELRTPLHGILAAAELLAEGPLNHSQESFLQTVQACGTSLQETVNHVLDFTKLSGNSKSGGVETSSLIGKVDLMQLVEEAVDGCWIGHRARTASTDDSAIGSVYSPPKEDHESAVVETVVDIGKRSKGWNLKCEKGGIRRVLMNLFGNSLKFTSRGYIHVMLRELPRSDEDPPDKVRLELAVSDTGKGISQNFLKNQMFHPFSQENPLQTGTGLGLAIVNSIVHSESVGGKVDVWSEEGVGTELKITFLAERPEEDGVSPLMVSFRTEDGAKLPTFSLIGFDQTHRGSKLQFEVIEQYLTSWWGLEIDPSGNGNVLILNEDASLVQKATERRDISHPFIVFSASREDQSIIKLAHEHERIGGFCRILYKPGGPSRLRPIVGLAIHAYKIGFQALEVEEPMSSLGSGDGLGDDNGSGGGSLRGLNREKEKVILGTGMPRRYSEESRGPSRAHSPRPGLGTRSTTAHPLSSWQNASSSGSEDMDRASSPEVSPEPTNAISTVPIGSDGSLLRSSMSTYDLPGQRRLKILVVEDNSILRSLLIKWLRQKGYEYHEAVDGQHGVSVYDKEGPFDVVLLDLSMPILDGVGATKEIRRIESTRNESAQDGKLQPATRILALTGMSSLEDKRRAFEAGVDGYLVKPVAFKTLNEMFSKLGFTS